MSDDPSTFKFLHCNPHIINQKNRKMHFLIPKKKKAPHYDKSGSCNVMAFGGGFVVEKVGKGREERLWRRKVGPFQGPKSQIREEPPTPQSTKPVL